MDLPIATALGEVKLAVLSASSASEKRRLNIYGRRIQCAPSCTGCCSRYIEVTLAEASIMVLRLKETGSWESVRRASEAMASLSKSTPSGAWFKLNVSCPVLDATTGLCRAHAVRPPVCSTHFATSAPAACGPWSSSGSPYEPVDFADLFIDSQRAIGRGLASHGILSISLPLPLALLMADRVAVRTGLSYEEAIAMIRQEL